MSSLLGRDGALLRDFLPAHALWQLGPVVDDIFGARIARVRRSVIAEVGDNNNHVAAADLATHPGHDAFAVIKIAVDKARFVEPERFVVGAQLDEPGDVIDDAYSPGIVAPLEIDGVQLLLRPLRWCIMLVG